MTKSEQKSRRVVRRRPRTKTARQIGRELKSEATRLEGEAARLEESGRRIRRHARELRRIALGLEVER